MSASTLFHELLNAAPDAMLVVDQRGRVTALNLEAERFLGWSEKDLLGESMTRFIPTRMQQMLESDLDRHRASRAVSASSAVLNCFALRHDGTEFPVEVSRRPLGKESDADLLVTLRDRSEWSSGMKTRSRNNEQVRATLESIGDSVITTDLNRRITYLNPVAERLTGWTAEEARGHSLESVLPLISEATRLPIANTAARCLETGHAVDLEEGVLLLRRDGAEIPIGDSAAPVRDRLGEVVGVVVVVQDESEKRVVGRRLSFEATHDALTGLINRREFERRLTRMVTNLAGAPAEHVVLCLDLDRFKLVNDSCGHDAGDALLRSLGPLLSRHLRKRDTLARIGGDEFGVLLENCPPAEAARIAEDIRAEFEQFRFEWAGTSFALGASIGLLAVTSDSGGIDAVLRAADAACYTAKESGGNRVQLEWLGGDVAQMSHARAGRITRLARAADEGHFRLYAQPIIPLKPEHAARPRIEILLRLPDGRGRMQAAAAFLPQAERYNLMPAIDRWVVRETIALLGEWHRDHPDVELPVCSINLSASSLADTSLVSVLERQLAQYGIPPGTICFEISETAALADLPRAVRFLSAIRAIGCGIALEDFRGGVTSFTYLKALPVDFLKIGGHFIQGIVEDPMYGSIVSAVDQIGRSMGIFTVAKHVGSEVVLDKLRELGIEYAQGHALTPPAPLTDTHGRVMEESLRQSA
jgi:diguanylate cyclase (GGDEF)-like protein/PAS domain S-box-containing protein